MFFKGVGGASTIVSKVVIMLLTIIGISFIMVIAFTIIKEGSKQIDLDQLTLDLEIKKAYLLNDSFVEVQVRRNLGNGELAGLAFVFFDGLESEILKKEIVLDELQEEVFVLELKDIDVNKIEDISVAPLLKGCSGEIITCNIKDKLEFVN